MNKGCCALPTSVPSTYAVTLKDTKEMRCHFFFLFEATKQYKLQYQNISTRRYIFLCFYLNFALPL